MSTNKGRMLSRTGWLGWDCECCGEPATKGQKRARGEREWRKTEEREYLDELWWAYYEDARRLADIFGFPAERAHREAAAFANKVLAAPYADYPTLGSRRAHE